MRKTSGWLSALVILASMSACTEPLGSDDEAGETDTDTDTGDIEAGKVCDPSAALSCGTELTCCSDDPAALDLASLDQSVTPAYQGGAGDGTPLFSGANNSLSVWGTCVEISDAAKLGTLTEPGAIGCPTPCNPTWTASDVEQVCGVARQCCQTQPIEVSDCVLDHEIGEVGCWRPVTGNDIIGLGGADATQWRLIDHATHQDPSGSNCRIFVTGILSSVLDSLELTTDDVLLAAYRRLGVADQRGYCSEAGTACAIDPAAPDACQVRNADELRTDCAELVP